MITTRNIHIDLQEQTRLSTIMSSINLEGTRCEITVYVQGTWRYHGNGTSCLLWYHRRHLFLIKCHHKYGTWNDSMIKVHGIARDIKKGVHDVVRFIWYHDRCACCLLWCHMFILHSLHTSVRKRTQLRSPRYHTTFVPTVKTNLSRISS